MRLAIVSLALLASVCARGEAQEANLAQDRTLRAMELTQDRDTDGIPPELRARILDKPRIAEETERRLLGLREAGNPHLPSGDGLLLPQTAAQDSSQVSAAELRELQMARIERRAPRLPGVAANASPTAASADDSAATSPEPAPHGSRRGPWVPVAVTLLVAGTLVSLAWFWRWSKR